MEEKVTLKPALEGLEVGEQLNFPIDKLYSVKTTASSVGLVMNRKYSTRVNREERTVCVERVS